MRISTELVVCKKNGTKKSRLSRQRFLDVPQAI